MERRNRIALRRNDEVAVAQEGGRKVLPSGCVFVNDIGGMGYGPYVWVGSPMGKSL